MTPQLFPISRPQATLVLWPSLLPNPSPHRFSHRWTYQTSSNGRSLHDQVATPQAICHASDTPEAPGALLNDGRKFVNPVSWVKDCWWCVYLLGLSQMLILRFVNAMIRGHHHLRLLGRGVNHTFIEVGIHLQPLVLRSAWLLTADSGIIQAKDGSSAA